MGPIKNITNLPPEFRRTERNEGEKRVHEKKPGGSGKIQPDTSRVVEPQDSVKLSDTAKTLLNKQEEVGRYLTEIRSAETLSREEAREIEAKIGDGFYDSPEVIAQVAASLARIPTMDVANLRGLTPERLQEIMEKIRNGEYDSDEVLDTIVDRIQKDLQ